MRAAARDQRLQQRRGRRGALQASARAERDWPCRRDGVLHGGATSQEHRVAGHVDASQRRGAVARLQQIGDAPAPAGGCTLGRGGLPVALLVVVGKQLRRQAHTAGLVLRLRGRLDQCADIQ